MKKLFAGLVILVGLVGCRDRGNRLVKAIEESMPKTVMIYNFVEYEEDGQVYKGKVSGAGVYVSPNGHVLTAAHLFWFGKVKSTVICDYDGVCVAGDLLAKEDRRDLALIKVNVSSVPYARIADPRNLRVGQEIFAIGNPLNLSFSVCHGIISALYRDVGGMYNVTQSDAMINPGNSGGPLFNLDGELIGINSFIIPVQPIIPLNTGLGFSVQSGQIIEFLTRFKGIEAILLKPRKTLLEKILSYL